MFWLVTYVFFTKYLSIKLNFFLACILLFCREEMKEVHLLYIGLSFPPWAQKGREQTKLCVSER